MRTNTDAKETGRVKLLGLTDKKYKTKKRKTKRKLFYKENCNLSIVKRGRGVSRIFINTIDS